MFGIPGEFEMQPVNAKTSFQSEKLFEYVL